MSCDASEVAKIEARLRAAANKLNELVNDVAKARQVKEFASDRRKTLLAHHMTQFLRSSQGVAAAEAFARDEQVYIDSFAGLEAQYLAAEQAIAQWQATMCVFEASRSLLSHSRETLRQL